MPRHGSRAGGERSPTATATLYRIRRGAPRGADVHGPPRLAGSRAAPHRRRGFDTKRWLVGKAALIPERADPATGFSPRGATVEEGSPRVPVHRERARPRVGAERRVALRAGDRVAMGRVTRHRLGRAADLPTHVERAVCQIMTHLAENEYAALYVPAKFIPRIHPRFTEVVMFLSTQVVDEARHIEAFTKRALASGGEVCILDGASRRRRSSRCWSRRTSRRRRSCCRSLARARSWSTWRSSSATRPTR